MLECILIAVNGFWLSIGVFLFLSLCMLSHEVCSVMSYPPATVFGSWSSSMERFTCNSNCGGVCFEQKELKCTLFSHCLVISEFSVILKSIINLLDIDIYTSTVSVACSSLFNSNTLVITACFSFWALFVWCITLVFSLPFHASAPTDNWLKIVKLLYDIRHSLHILSELSDPSLSGKQCLTCEFLLNMNCTRDGAVVERSLSEWKPWRTYLKK